MIPDDMPDYMQYTLRDLYDVARRIDKARYADRYALVLKEIARREESGWNQHKPATIPDKRSAQPLRDWLFEGENSGRTGASVMAWWEKRRLFWCQFVSFLLFSSVSTMLLFALVVDAGSRPNSIVEWLMLLFGTLLGLFFFWVLVMIVANIAFCFVCLADLIFGVPLRFLGWRLSAGLFAAILVTTIMLAVFPVVILLISFIQQ